MNSPLKHNVYTFEDGGRVESLGYKTEEGHDATHGVVVPGSTRRFDFGIAKRREQIVVVQGLIGAKGRLFRAFETITFEVGEQIELACAAPSAYNCIYTE